MNVEATLEQTVHQQQVVIVSCAGKPECFINTDNKENGLC